MNEDMHFPATSMPDKDWWQALWPDPQAVLSAVGLKANMQAVDLCCGDGHFTQAMCQMIKSGQVWGLDMNQELLNQTQALCQPFEHFQPVFADARELPKHIAIPLDFVFMANTFHGVPDKTGLSQAVHTSLKPGARFAIVNWYQKPREETIVLNQARGPAIEMRMSPEQVQKLIEPAGFTLEKVVEVGAYHYGVVFLKS